MTNKYTCEKIEPELSAKFCEGDPSAIADVYNKMKDQSLSWACRHIGENFNFQDAEQASSEAWLKLLKSKHTIRDSRTIMAFLKKAVNSTCLDMLRRVTSRKEESVSSLEEGEGRVLNDLVCIRSQTPYATLVNKEEKATLKKIISSLDTIYFEALVGFLEGRSYAALAEQCDCPIGTVKRRIFHARKLVMERSAHLREV